MSPVADHIVQKTEPVLRKQAAAVLPEEFGSKKLEDLIARMKALLAKEKYGVGLAAPQVGASVRLFIVAGRVFMEDEEDDEEHEHTSKEVPPDKVFINPEIVRLSKKSAEMSEGCLSVRGLYGAVQRHEKATVRAYDEHGKLFTYHGSGLLAQIFQHEIDHLDGVLYIDKVTRLEESTEETEEPTPKRRTPTKRTPAVSKRHTRTRTHLKINDEI